MLTFAIATVSFIIGAVVSYLWAAKVVADVQAELAKLKAAGEAIKSDVEKL